MVVFLHTLQRTILTVLRYILTGLPDDGTYDVPKHVGYLLTSDVCIFWCTWALISISLGGPQWVLLCGVLTDEKGPLSPNRRKNDVPTFWKYFWRRTVMLDIKYLTQYPWRYFYTLCSSTWNSVNDSIFLWTSFFNATFPHWHHHFILQCDFPSMPAPFDTLRTPMLLSSLSASLHTSMWPSITASTSPYFNMKFHRCHHLSMHFILQCDLPSLPAPLHTSIWSSIAASTCRCTSCFNVSFHRCQYLSKHPPLGHLITTVVTVTYILGIYTLIF